MITATSANLRGNGTTAPFHSTHAAVIATVMRAPTPSSASSMPSHSDAVSSRYGAHRLIGGTYLRNRKLPGNGTVSGPTRIRVTPYTSCRFEAAPTSSRRSATPPLIENLLVHPLGAGRTVFPSEHAIDALPVRRAELPSQARVREEHQHAPRHAGDVRRAAQEAPLAV